MSSKSSARGSKPLKWKSRAPKSPSLGEIRRRTSREEKLHARLSSFGTILSGVAALVSVIIATSFGWMAHRYQVERDRFELIDQASRINFWVETDGVHVLNRSPDPVVKWGLLFTDADPEGDTASILVFARLDMNTIPPCIELILDWELMNEQVNGELNSTATGSYYFNLSGMYFDDRHGKEWYRLYSSGLTDEAPIGLYVPELELRESIVSSGTATVGCEAS